MSLHLPATTSSDSFVLRHRMAIFFLTVALCLAGGYAAYVMPASVFPQTDFPRVLILIDNDAMSADEIMATITRPIEEAMKNIPGTTNIHNGRGLGIENTGGRLQCRNRASDEALTLIALTMEACRSGRWILCRLAWGKKSPTIRPPLTCTLWSGSVVRSAVSPTRCLRSKSWQSPLATEGRTPN